MNKNKEWEKDFRHKWEGANGTLCSVTIDSMIKDISVYISQAEDNMRKRCLECKPSEPDNQWEDYYHGWGDLEEQWTQNINNLDKGK